MQEEHLCKTHFIQLNLGRSVGMIRVGYALIKCVFIHFTALKLLISKYNKGRNMNLGPTYYHRKYVLRQPKP